MEGKNEIITFPLGYSINLLMFTIYVERRRLYVKVTALLIPYDDYIK